MHTGLMRSEHRSRLSALLAVLLSAATLLVGFHHHPDGSEHGDCAICSVVHMPTEQAVVPDVVPTPALRPERLVVAPRPFTGASAPRATSCRAPPSA